MENLFTQREITQLLVVEDEYKTLTHNESINKLNSIAKLNKWSQRVALDKAIGEWEWCNDNKTVIKLIKSLLYINEFKTEGLKGATVKEVFENQCGLFSFNDIAYKPSFLDVRADNIFYSYRWFKFLNKEVVV